MGELVKLEAPRFDSEPFIFDHTGRMGYLGVPVDVVRSLEPELVEEYKKCTYDPEGTLSSVMCTSGYCAKTRTYWLNEDDCWGIFVKAFKRRYRRAPEIRDVWKDED